MRRLSIIDYVWNLIISKRQKFNENNICSDFLTYIHLLLDFSQRSSLGEVTHCTGGVILCSVERNVKL